MRKQCQSTLKLIKELRLSIKVKDGSQSRTITSVINLTMNAEMENKSKKCENQVKTDE